MAHAELLVTCAVQHSLESADDFYRGGYCQRRESDFDEF